MEKACSPFFIQKIWLIIKELVFSKIKTNDLILALKNNLAFTHRVIYKADNYLVTKGDNNLESDGKINSNQIIGKAVSVKRKNKIIDPEMIYLIQSSFYFKEIVKVVNFFEENNINYVFLKGLPVHLYYEKTHPRRIYQDADVLIERKDYKKVKTILGSLRYKSSDFSPFIKNRKIADHVEISFYRLVNGFPIVFDVHLEAVFLMVQINNIEAIYPQKLVTQFTHDLLITKKKVIISGQQLFILNTRYLILYLALHFFHHNFTGAFRLEFINTILKKNNYLMDDRLQDSIKKYRLQNFVYPVFYLLKKYYQTPISIQFLSSRIYHLGSIFDDQTRFEAGINRFKNIFLFSPNPLFKRVLILTNFKVIYLILFTIYYRLKKYFNPFKLNIWKTQTKSLK